MEVTRNQAAVVIAAVLVAIGVGIPYFSGAFHEPEGIANANETDWASFEAGGADGESGYGSMPLAAGAPGGGGGSGGEAASGGAGAQKPKPVPDTGLGLRVQVVDREAGEGQPVRARVWLENVGRNPVPLCDGATDLSRRVELLYRWRNVNYCAAAPATGFQPLDTTNVAELAPGRAIEAIVDLRPLFDQALGFGEGPFHFRLAYRGDGTAVPQSIRAWNSDASMVATSDELVFHVALPAWFETLGGDGELLNSLGSRVSLWAPGSPEDDAMFRHVRDLGAPAVAALAIHASRMGGPEPSAGPRARKCLQMLRNIGADALPTLRQAPESPAVAMAIAAIEEDGRDAAGSPPADASRPFRAIGGGGTDGTTFTVSSMRQGFDGSAVYSFDASGTVFVTRFTGRDARKTVALPLAAEQVADVKRTILRARPWLWKPVREQRRAGEGEIAFSLADAGGGMTWLVSLRGDEARRGNPFASEVLRAFRVAAGDPDEPETSEASAAPALTPPAAPAPGDGR